MMRFFQAPGWIPKCLVSVALSLLLAGMTLTLLGVIIGNKSNSVVSKSIASLKAKQKKDRESAAKFEQQSLSNDDLNQKQWIEFKKNNQDLAVPVAAPTPENQTKIPAPRVIIVERPAPPPPPAPTPEVKTRTVIKYKPHPTASPLKWFRWNSTR